MICVVTTIWHKIYDNYYLLDFMKTELEIFQKNKSVHSYCLTWFERNIGTYQMKFSMNPSKEHFLYLWLFRIYLCNEDMFQPFFHCSFMICSFHCIIFVTLICSVLGSCFRKYKHIPLRNNKPKHSWHKHIWCWHPNEWCVGSKLKHQLANQNGNITEQGGDHLSPYGSAETTHKTLNAVFFLGVSIPGW